MTWPGIFRKPDIWAGKGKEPCKNLRLSRTVRRWKATTAGPIRWQRLPYREPNDCHLRLRRAGPCVGFRYGSKCSRSKVWPLCPDVAGRDWTCAGIYFQILPAEEHILRVRVRFRPPAIGRGHPLRHPPQKRGACTTCSRIAVILTSPILLHQTLEKNC